MYAVIKTGGHQEKVEVGQTLRVDLTEDEVGSDIAFPSVLLVAEGDDVQVGTPVVEGAAVKGEVLAHVQGDKVVVFKKRRRARYRVKRGHRQQYLEVIITEIAAGGKTAKCDDKAVGRARVRAAAIAEQKKQKVKPTRAQKIAAGEPKPRSKKQLRRDAKTAAKA
jgi:large subunit ribosomal protein L21